MFRSILIVLALFVATESRADFILVGDQHLEVVSSHAAGVLYDSSTADLVSGGSVKDVYVYDEALLQVLGGSIAGHGSGVYDTGKMSMSSGEIHVLNVYDTGDVNITGGETTSWLYAHDASTVDISDGDIRLLSARGNSRIRISGGKFYSHLQAWDSVHLDISGGVFLRPPSLNDTSVTNISGGYFLGGGTICVADSSTLNVSGGTLSSGLHAMNASILSVSDCDFGSLQASGTSTIDVFSGSSFDTLVVSGPSTITFHGYDFRVLGGLRLEDGEVSGIHRGGTLIGKWPDGTPWAVSVGGPSHTFATIRVIPEPTTLILLIIATAGLLAYSWSRRARRSSTGHRRRETRKKGA